MVSVRSRCGLCALLAAALLVYVMLSERLNEHIEHTYLKQGSRFHDFMHTSKNSTVVPTAEDLIVFVHIPRTSGETLKISLFNDLSYQFNPEWMDALHCGEGAEAFAEHDLYADVAIFAKAIRFAIKYGEFYDQRPVVQGWIDNGIEGPSGKSLTPERKAELEAMLAKMPSATSSADELMEAAEARLGELEAGGAASWTEPTAAVSAPYEHGCVARGYVSVIDGSPQPYGLELPPSLPADGGKVPLYVWLHGRGAQSTDLHFIRERMRSRGQMAPLDGGIVLHPFGRQCIGYKSAGAIDVLHAIEAVKEQYPIDVDRIVLYGFSMGGAGSWSIGAHYPDLWAVVQPGAGFAETFLFYDDEGRPEDGPNVRQPIQRRREGASGSHTRTGG